MTYSYTQNTLLGNPNSTLIQLEHLDLGWVRFHPSGNTPIFPNYLALLNPEYNIVGPNVAQGRWPQRQKQCKYFLKVSFLLFWIFSERIGRLYTIEFAISSIRYEEYQHIFDVSLAPSVQIMTDPNNLLTDSRSLNDLIWSFLPNQ